MPYNLYKENIIIHNKTRDILPSISSTILHVRYSEHANSKSVQSSPIWRYNGNQLYQYVELSASDKISELTYHVPFSHFFKSKDPNVSHTCKPLI